MNIGLNRKEMIILKIFNDFENWKLTKVLQKDCIDLKYCDIDSRKILQDISNKYNSFDGFLYYPYFVIYMSENNFNEELIKITDILFINFVSEYEPELKTKIGADNFNKIIKYIDLFVEKVKDTNINLTPYGYLTNFCENIYHNTVLYSTLLSLSKIIENKYPQIISIIYSKFNSGRYLSATGCDFFKYICDNILLEGVKDTNVNLVNTKQDLRIIDKDVKDYNTNSEMVKFAIENQGLPLIHVLENISRTYNLRYGLTFFSEVVNNMYSNVVTKELKFEFEGYLNKDNTLTVKGIVFIFVTMFCVSYDGFDRDYIFNNLTEKSEILRIKQNKRQAIFDILYLSEKIVRGEI